MAYKLSSILDGHKNDVRCLAAFPGDALVSGSRDMKVKLWSSDEGGKNWNEQITYEGHTAYVTSLAVMPSNETYPDGLIYTGSNDGVIRAYVPHDVNPNHLLHGHSANVASLFISKNQTLLSGSWDTTARVWLNQKTVMTLKDHEAGVWCGVILSEVGLMVTGAADGNMKVWKGGMCKSSTKAHAQSVRDIVVISRDEVATCSNDGRICFWSIDTTNFKVTMRLNFEDSEFIYSLSTLNGGSILASAGESTGVKVFVDGRFNQNLPIPALSAWCVRILDNGDIAVGCSDNRIYVFTQNPEREASVELIALYDAEVSRFKEPKEEAMEQGDDSGLPEEVGGVKVADMPGPEVLDRTGRRDGQTVMVREGNTVSVHSWSQADGQWRKVGDVVGQPKSKDPSGRGLKGGKVMYEGKEYDHVFHIDIDEGVVLKLPYNNGEEPFEKAQAFIHQHGLPQEYLEQIANFIIKNSSGGGAFIHQQGSSGDPLTGGNAYVSGSGGVQASSFTNGGGGSADPFTGGNAYTTTNGGSQPIMHDFYPQKVFLKFSAVPKLDAVIGKLTEFNTKVPSNLKLAEDQLESVASLGVAKDPQAVDVGNLVKILNWPKDQVFPCLDLLRLSLANPVAAELLLAKHSEELLDLLLQNLTTHDKAANQMLALRSLANLFNTDKGMHLMLSQHPTIIHQLSALFPIESKPAQIAMSTVVLNYSIASTDKAVNEELQSTCLSLSLLFLQGMTDSEARFRNMVAIGTLLDSNPVNLKEAKKLDAKEKVNTAQLLDSQDKIQSCAKALLQSL